MVSAFRHDPHENVIKDYMYHTMLRTQAFRGKTGQTPYLTCENLADVTRFELMTSSVAGTKLYMNYCTQIELLQVDEGAANHSALRSVDDFHPRTPQNTLHSDCFLQGFLHGIALVHR